MSTAVINDPARCQWCGNFHAFKCPLVKSIEYNQDGTQKRVEFFAPNDYGPRCETIDWNSRVAG